MRLAVLLVLIGCGGREGSVEIGSVIFLPGQALEITQGAPVAVGTPLMACPTSDRTRPDPLAAFFPGGRLNERSTIPVESVAIEVEPANLVERSDREECAYLTTQRSGRVTVHFTGTVDGHESETEHSFRIVEAEPKAEWETDTAPLLVGERVSARVWREASGTRVVSAPNGLDLPRDAMTERDGLVWRVTWPVSSSAVLPALLPERARVERAERMSVELEVDEGGAKQIIVRLHLGERTFDRGAHTVTIRTPERCSTRIEAGSVDAPEVSEHEGAIPIRARENAPEGPCELTVETRLFDQAYTHEASLTL